MRIAIAAGVVALLVGLLALMVVKRPPDGSSPARVPERTVDPALLVRFHSPSFGDANAKVHIVEFLDPACGTCRDFYPFVKQMIAANPGRIRLSVRYAPFHKGSDQVVRLLEAARRQGKYWQTVEAIFAGQSQWVIDHTANVDLALRVVGGVGLDMARLRQDMASPDLARLIEQDMQDGAALNVNKTPEFFVNGRPLPRFGYEELKTLVDRALREAYS
jgi:protein-disulfide isomerase